MVRAVEDVADDHDFEGAAVVGMQYEVRGIAGGLADQSLVAEFPYPADDVRRCKACHEEKPLEQFYLKRRGGTRRSALCKPCESAATVVRRQHPVMRRRLRLQQTATRRQNVDRQLRWLATHPCVDCGERDPVLLDFDHRDGVNKRAQISRLLPGAWATILEEILKCDVRCANCHRRRTAAVQDWYANAGRDHLADLRMALDGQTSLFEAPSLPRQRPPVVLGLAEALNRNPIWMDEGVTATVIARFVVARDEPQVTLQIVDAVIVDREVTG